jgi:hypothetical protein
MPAGASPGVRGAAGTRCPRLGGHLNPNGPLAAFVEFQIRRHADECAGRIPLTISVEPSGPA